MTLKKNPTPDDIYLLLSFLSDTDPTTKELAHKHLREAWQRDPSVKSHLLTVRDSLIQKSAMALFHEFHREELEKQFDVLADQGENLDLEMGAFLVSSFAYPQCKKADLSRQLDELADGVKTLIDSRSNGPEDGLNAIRDYLFRVVRFEGNIRHYYEPDNGFLNQVLERKRGIPISLSVVYLLVGWRLEMDVSGVGFPGHFIVGHQVGPIQYLVDCFHTGRILSQQDCDVLLKQHGLTFRPEFLAVTSPRQILYRMILNLVNIYTDRKEREKADWLSKILNLFQ